MGSGGRPGASLRAFKEFFPHAGIYGADIDKRVLFQEERIKTFFVDQTRPSSFLELRAAVPPDLDLFIDDGLHSPDANIASLNFGLGKIRVGGWTIIEDIALESVPIWEVVSAMLPDRYRSHIFRARGGFLFAAERIS